MYITLDEIAYYGDQESWQTTASGDVQVRIFALAVLDHVGKHLERCLDDVLLAAFFEIIGSHLETLNDLVQEVAILPQS